MDLNITGIILFIAIIILIFYYCFSALVLNNRKITENKSVIFKFVPLLRILIGATNPKSTILDIISLAFFIYYGKYITSPIKGTTMIKLSFIEIPYALLLGVLFILLYLTITITYIIELKNSKTPRVLQREQKKEERKMAKEDPNEFDKLLEEDVIPDSNPNELYDASLEAVENRKHLAEILDNYDDINIEKKKCTKCGVEIDKENKVCPFCGKENNI